jgi:hypothetical protein
MKRHSTSKSETHPSRRIAYWAAVLGALLLAAVFRAALITEVPPGIIHDEVWNRANVQHVFDGELPPYYPEGGGREALYLFVQAASVALLGDNLIAMRLPSITFGVALVALTCALGARLFNRAVGLVAALTLASCFWAVLFSRLAVRNISLPAVLALGVYVLYRALTDRASPRDIFSRFLLAGFLLGLAPYTFPGAWGLPVFLGPLTLYLALFERERMRGRWAGLAVTLGVALLMAVPPVAYRQAHPEATARALQVDAPLRAALERDFGPVLNNVPLVLSMFTVEGDHGLEYNLQWRPVFPEPLISALFYLGIALALWRLLRPRRLPYVLVLLLSLAMLAPTILTSDARNPSRPIGLLAVLFFYVGLGAGALWTWLGARWGKAGRRAAVALIALAVALNVFLTARDLFDRWADNPVVRFLYQDELYDIARYLDASGEEAVAEGPVTIAGLTPDWVDPTSLRILMARRDLSPGFFDGQGALLVPAEGAARVLVPNTLTLHPAVEGMLAQSGQSFAEAGFVRWEVPAGVAPPPDYTVTPVNAPCPLATLTAVAWDAPPAPGRTVKVLTAWQTHGPSDTRLRIFVHLMDGGQRDLLAQHDDLDVPSLQWRTGEVFFQTHALNIPPDLPPGEYALRVGLYDPLTGARVRFDDGADAATLPLTFP